MPKTYESLNDASKNYDLPNSLRVDFEPGPVEIWYAKNPTFVDGMSPHVENLFQSHVCLGRVARVTTNVGDLTETELERIFWMMQGEIWSAKGEARNLIRARGLYHTSMSVGDCVKHGENIWMVANFGWKKIS